MLHPTDTQFGDSPGLGRLVERDNVYIKSGTPQVRGTVAEPRNFYSYTREEPANIATIVTQARGGRQGRVVILETPQADVIATGQVGLVQLQCSRCSKFSLTERISLSTLRGAVIP